jgi:hypothetical protein
MNKAFTRIGRVRPSLSGGGGAVRSRLQNGEKLAKIEAFLVAGHPSIAYT